MPRAHLLSASRFRILLHKLPVSPCAADWAVCSFDLTSVLTLGPPSQGVIMSSLSWCAWRDLNPHAEALHSKCSVSTYFTTGALFEIFNISSIISYRVLKQFSAPSVYWLQSRKDCRYSSAAFLSSQVKCFVG